MTDLLTGRVQLMNGTSTSVLAHVKAGKLRALATMFDKRSPLLPDVPSIVEAGQATLPIGPWFRLGRTGRPAFRDCRRHEQGDGCRSRQACGHRADAKARLHPEVVDAGRACELHERPARALERSRSRTPASSRNEAAGPSHRGRPASWRQAPPRPSIPDRPVRLIVPFNRRQRARRGGATGGAAPDGRPRPAVRRRQTSPARPAVSAPRSRRAPRPTATA